MRQGLRHKRHVESVKVGDLELFVAFMRLDKLLARWRRWRNAQA